MNIHSSVKTGKLVIVKTRGEDSAQSNAAPPLSFSGRLESIETQERGKEEVKFIHLSYWGLVAKVNHFGKLIGWERGNKVLSIPIRNVVEVTPLTRG
ncbi:hypothetical protein [Dyadobacter sp. LHD-138]|uniref:hypothetical protein n=1 Tax=Dyadobacter sp. LHD-138 TaxID=3071413 RepID=UPI0027E01B71|nr:hypothetical protein [Dyadobacter sp. LHD-138]MDQ6477826.1 hypothetical protein [Dyadobacter sp. LHD-138]